MESRVARGGVVRAFNHRRCDVENFSEHSVERRAERMRNPRVRRCSRRRCTTSRSRRKALRHRVDRLLRHRRSGGGGGRGAAGSSGCASLGKAELARSARAVAGVRRRTQAWRWRVRSDPRWLIVLALTTGWQHPGRSRARDFRRRRKYLACALEGFTCRGRWSAPRELPFHPQTLSVQGFHGELHAEVADLKPATSSAAPADR